MAVSQDVRIKVSGDTVIHGNIDSTYTSYSSAKMSITTDSIRKVNVSFKGYVDSKITIQSPYLNLYIDNLTYNDTSSWSSDFPIGFSFNKDTASYVYVKSFNFGRYNSTSSNIFESFPVITAVYTDEDLDKSAIGKGFVFLDLPSNSITAKTYRQKLNTKAPSVLKAIPGFISDGYCMSIKTENTDRMRVAAYKSKSAYTLPAYICITSGSKCSNYNTYPYTYVTSLADGDLSPYVGAGYKEIYIATTIYGKEIKLDFSTLKGDGYKISLVGYSSTESRYSWFSIKDNSNKIKNISIQNAKLIDSFTFAMTEVNLLRVSLEKNKDFKFGSNTLLTADALTLEAFFKLTNIPQFNEINLVHDYVQLAGYDYYYEESIDITNDVRYKICLRGYQDDGWDWSSVTLDDKKPSLAGINFGWDYKEICAEGIDSKYFKKLNYLSRNSLTFNIKSMDPKTINPINIAVSPRYSWTSYAMKLSGDGWDKKLSNKFKIDNGKNFITIKVSSPGQAENIDIIGSASALFKVDYQSEKTYCVYNKSDGRTCYSPWSFSGTKQTKYDEFVASIPNITDTNINIRFDNIDTPHKIPLSLFNQRKVTLRTSFSFKELSQVEIDFDDSKKIDPIYSLTVFDKINTTYTKDTDVTATFGQLSMTNSWSANDKWIKHVKLVASQLICNYKHLSMFNGVTITDQLNVSGPIPTEGNEITVKFEKDNDANDLVTSIKGNVTLTIGEGFVKIGTVKFMISHSSNYDAYFRVNGKANITVDSSITSKKDFLRFVIDCQFHEVNISFKGVYPSLSKDELSLIMLKGTGKVNITTEWSVPLSLHNFIDTEFHLMSENVKSITGPIEYKSSITSTSYGRIRFYDHQLKKISLEIPNGILIKKIDKNDKLIGIMSPNISLTIGKVTKELESSQGVITLTNTIGNTGASKIIFSQSLPEGITFSNITYVITQVYGKIKDESTFPFISQPETIIKARTEDLIQLTFTFKYFEIVKKDFTHGFYSSVNCLEVNQTRDADQYSSVILKAFKNPSEIPFIIDFVTNDMKTDGELIINDNNIKELEDLSSLLPTIFVGIVMRLYRDMDSEFVLNLEKIIKDRKSISVDVQSVGRNPFTFFMTLSSSKILDISLKNVIIGFKTTGQGNFIANTANFTDCKFLNLNQIKISNEMPEIHMDVDSFNSLVDGSAFNSYPGKVFVNSANVILFTKDGWEFREDRARPTVEVKSNMFKNIQFKTKSFCLLMIQDETLEKIHPFSFNSYHDDQGIVLFELSRHWRHVKDLGGFKVNVNGAERVNLNTASYPIPKMFDIDDSKIGYTFETDVSGEFDTITLESNRIFKDEDLNANFNFLPPEYQFIEGDKVQFEGNSHINFVDDVGTLRVNESSFRSRSNTTISRLETLKSMTVDRTAEITGTFKFALSSKLQLHWTLAETPIINQKNFEKGSPQLLEIIYDDSSADKDLYREKLLRKNGIILMRGNFECSPLKNNVRFGGNFAPFGADNIHLKVSCDLSAQGQVLLLQGLTDLPDSGDDSQAGGGKAGNVSSGGVAGIVIACIIVGLLAAGVVYFLQRKKIDRLKNEIPADNSSAYRSSAYETRETTQSSSDYKIQGTEDPFDDV